MSVILFDIDTILIFFNVVPIPSLAKSIGSIFIGVCSVAIPAFAVFFVLLASVLYYSDAPSLRPWLTKLGPYVNG